MRILYQRTDKEIPQDFLPSEVQKDILDNWKPHYNLFSISQISDRTGYKRGHVQRKVKQLRKMGLVRLYNPNKTLNDIYEPKANW